MISSYTVLVSVSILREQFIQIIPNIQIIYAVQYHSITVLLKTKKLQIEGDTSATDDTPIKKFAILHENKLDVKCDRLTQWIL